MVTPPPFNFFTRTLFTPFILPGFCLRRKRVSAADTRFTAFFFLFFAMALMVDPFRQHGIPAT